MNTLAQPLRLHRPWPLRMLSAIADAVTGWREAFETRSQRRRAEAALRDLDGATLRDMGAPSWLQEEARVRREHRRFDRQLLRIHDRSAGTASLRRGSVTSRRCCAGAR